MVPSWLSSKLTGMVNQPTSAFFVRLTILSLRLSSHSIITNLWGICMPDITCPELHSTLNSFTTRNCQDDKGNESRLLKTSLTKFHVLEAQCKFLANAQPKWWSIWDGTESQLFRRVQKLCENCRRSTSPPSLHPIRADEHSLSCLLELADPI